MSHALLLITPWVTHCVSPFYTRMLNFTDAVSILYHSSGTGPVWMDNMQCVGNETRLELCSFLGWGIKYCNSYRAGVVCDSECVYVCVCVCVCVSVCECV